MASIQIITRDGKIRSKCEYCKYNTLDSIEMISHYLNAHNEIDL